MSGGEAIRQSATGTATPTFNIEGGIYQMAAAGNFNSATVILNELGPDGTSFITTGNTLSAAGVLGPLYLPPGQYQLNFGSVTAVSVGLVRIQI
jgi:hypothetical protein